MAEKGGRKKAFTLNLRYILTSWCRSAATTRDHKLREVVENQQGWGRRKRGATKP